jgi:hypothetical protein
MEIMTELVTPATTVRLFQTRLRLILTMTESVMPVTTVRPSATASSSMRIVITSVMFATRHRVAVDVVSLHVNSSVEII